jgi:hypothetical protein
MESAAMKRLYYLTRDLDAVDRISRTLHEAGISDWNFHVLSKDKAGLTTHRIHSTTPLHERDIIHSSEQGAIIGALLGVCVAFILIATGVLSATPMGYLGAAVLAFVIFMHGVWAGGFAGIQRENYKIRQFHNELEEGQYLLMIDVARRDEQTIAKLMSLCHEATPMGDDSTLITPFGKPRPLSF